MMAPTFILCTFYIYIEFVYKYKIPSQLVLKKAPVQCSRHMRHGFDPGLGRFPGGGHGNPLQYSCLGSPKDIGAWQATVHESQRVRHD